MFTDFNSSNPELWFLTEGLPRNYCVHTEDAKFSQLLQCLNAAQEQIQNVVQNYTKVNSLCLPILLNSYTSAKEKLMETYGKTEEKRLRKLLNNTKIMPDEKPSQVLQTF